MSRFERTSTNQPGTTQQTKRHQDRNSVDRCPHCSLLKSASQPRASVQPQSNQDPPPPPHDGQCPVVDPGSRTLPHSIAAQPQAPHARTPGPPIKGVPSALARHVGALEHKLLRFGSSVSAGEPKGSRPSSIAFPFAKLKAQPVPRPCELLHATTERRQDAIHCMCWLQPSRLGAPTGPRSPAGGSIIAYPLEVPWERHGVPLGRLRRGPRGCATEGPNLANTGFLYTEVSPGSGVRPHPPGHLALH